MIDIKKVECPKNKYSIKCPYEMKPTRIVIHNTANDAPAKNEIEYMHRNGETKSFHYAVDDKAIIQGIALNRNAFHAGDGKNGIGNREGIAIEICYSKSGGERFEKAQKNAAELTAKLLKENGWGIDKVTKHEDYSGKHCPHRTLDQYGWEFFIGLVKDFMGVSKTEKTTLKSITKIANEVIAGKWGNGDERKRRLTEAGYDFDKVQAKVNELLKSKVAKLSIEQVAQKVIKGDYGNGHATRKKKLEAEGYDYETVRAKVNEILKNNK